MSKSFKREIRNYKSSLMSDRETIVVTGIGVITSIGNTRRDFWGALINGTSGIREITAFDATGQKTRIASEVRSLQVEHYLDKKLIRKMARVSQFAACAAIEAIKDSGINLQREDVSRIGCVVGSAAGDYNFLEEQHSRFIKMGHGSVNPFAVPKIIPNMPASNIGIVLGVHGPNLGVSTACATGTHAIGLASGFLRQGLADVMIAGGSESTITPFVVDGYSRMGVLSEKNDEPEKASRPFNINRDGFVIGEGAGVLVLESLERVKKRGAEPLAVISGYAMTSDAYSFAIPEPEGKWAAAAMQQALQNAHINPESVAFINAHGTSTPANDKIESLAIKKVFGVRNRQVAVSSNKSMIGHTLGAAGGIEAAATVLSVHTGIIPPTINYDMPDPECNVNIVANVAREVDIEAAISNSFGFGGQNSVVVFSRI